MQTLTRMDKEVIEAYYHLTKMDENLNRMEPTYLLSIFPLNPTGPFCTSTFTSTFLIAFLNVHTRKKII
jgi:hypothetical protein